MGRVAYVERSVERILALRRAEAAAPQVEEIAAVRTDLERELGPTLSRGMTAHLLGVTQPAIDRWVSSGDIATVITPKGAVAVPAAAVVELVEELRSRPPAEHRRLAGVMRARRARGAAHLDAARRALRDADDLPVKGHRVAELRSLAIHALVAAAVDHRTVAGARRRLESLARDGLIDPRSRASWDDVLALSLTEIKRTLTADTQRARDLRQNSPFAGVAPEAARRAVLELVAP